MDGHFLHRNCLLIHVIEGKVEERMEMTGRRGRRPKQLLDDLKETRGYCELKETLSSFRRVSGSVIRQARKLVCE
jgi:hypothetical protein